MAYPLNPFTFTESLQRWSEHIGSGSSNSPIMADERPAVYDKVSRGPEFNEKKNYVRPSKKRIKRKVRSRFLNDPCPIKKRTVPNTSRLPKRVVLPPLCRTVPTLLVDRLCLKNEKTLKNDA